MAVGVGMATADQARIIGQQSTDRRYAVGDTGLFGGDIVTRAKELFEELRAQPEDVKIAAINAIRKELHEHSPFAAEPVDCVLWVPIDKVEANDYNPNAVAPPEMRLLERSIQQDGFTQPIVAWQTNEHFEVVDGFHRNRVGRECASVQKRIRGYLPLTIINPSREDRGDRIAATIRHNRARGKHKVEAMSDIVIELKRRNWSDERIGNDLGMDPDEVLRLTQISSLTEMFQGKEFSEAWEHTGQIEGEEIVDGEDGEVNLEWMGTIHANRAPGWNDRTENSSVLYGDAGLHLGVIQKSRFTESEWFWYAYCQPMREGRAVTRDEAKAQVEEHFP